MYRYNHLSRCAECTRYHAIKDLHQMNPSDAMMAMPTIVMCRDCWYNEDVR